MTKSPFIKQLASLVALVGIFMFSGTVFFQLQTAFGWTNPAASPPGGNGGIMVDPVTQNIGIKIVGNGPLPSAKLVIGNAPAIPAVDTQGTDIIGLPPVPNGPTAAASKAYVDAQVGGGGGGGGSGSGGGSIVLYYKTASNLPAPAPTCPSGWTSQYTGYGPHYLGVLNYGWLNSNGGYGGFGGAGGIYMPPPSSGSSFVLNSLAIGSDSVCSQSQTATVPFNLYYANSVQTDFTSMKANACYTDSVTGVMECNRCLVCQK